KKDKKGKKEELIGKCILVHLSPKEVNVALVPTQSGKNLQEAIAKVQQIYEKVGVTLHITTERPFDISDQLKNGTLPTENEFGDLSTYSPEQNAVIAKFTTNRKPKENTYYIFLVNDGTGDHGYMRLGGQYGFVYSTNARTIAHELGHGIFKLEHPFKGKNADKGKTSALMDYNEGQDFFYRDWKQINDPKVKLYAFQGQGEGEYNVNAHLGLTPDGVIFDTFFFKGKKINTTIEVAPDKYTIQKISYQGNQYYWDKQSKAFVGAEGSIKVKREAKNINNKVNIYRSRKDGCTYDYLTIPWETKDEQSTNIVQTIEKYIAQYNESYWRIAPYTVRDASCGKEFFTHLRDRDLQECSTAEINEGRKILQGLLAEANPERVTLSVNNYCMAAISGLTYGEIEKLFDIIASQERITEHSEVALLRLMSGIKTTDYKRFYTHLEANGNKLLKHLIEEIDDASVNFLTDKKNYTNFIGALVWMFNHNPASIEDRWGKNEEDFAKRTLNLNPISYSEYSSFMYSSSTSKKNEGEYVSATGNIKLYDVYTIESSKTVLVKGDVPIDVVKQRELITEVSPLTPLIIVPDKDKLPLLQTALEGNNLGNEVYIVPAIFLKYSNDKIRNDYIEKGVITTLDVATIALSGGTALATKVHWVRRAWALAEVVGAVGNIVVNTQDIDPNSLLGQVVNSYNLAIGVIGIKNLGQAGYKFAKNLPQATKELLQKNGNLRAKLISYYQKWQTEVAQLDNPSQAEKQLVEKQAEVWKALGLWDEIIDGIPSNFFRNANDLGETYDTFNKLSKTVRGEAFNYYKQQKWDKLEQLFKTYKLKWPPADGGYNIIYNVSLKKGMKFDRYGNAIKETLKGETPILAGEFTSPIINGKRYSFSQRALNKLESEYDFYYEIEIIKDIPFSGDSADIIPWFNQIGKGKQMKWNIPINPKTNFPKTWNELVREGYIRVIIKDSPSGKYKYLINKEIK
ncbi:PF14021 family protein, partial [Capnocytophaga sp. oral taxon 412 str. F0487]|uniref:glycohydrolase toxin TNT-related protein n=1 Tax=Capnocytophaga sp. oral taxon 412 TaxID=712218 RepID=UPI000269701A